MRLFPWIACGLILSAAAGCGSDGDADGDGAVQYPDIPGLVAFYRFDGDLNNAVSDIHHGTASGTAVYVADHRGTANSAVQVDSDTIKVADHAELDITEALTISAWVKPGLTVYAFATLVDKAYLSAYSFGMGGASAPDTVSLEAFLAYQGFLSDEVVPIGTGAWSHVAFTYDAGTGEGKFYLNGALVGGESHGVAMTGTDSELRIGTSIYADKYKGAIDQLALFNRALTAGEVTELYTFE